MTDEKYVNELRQMIESYAEALINNCDDIETSFSRIDRIVYKSPKTLLRLDLKNLLGLIALIEDKTLKCDIMQSLLGTIIHTAETAKASAIPDNESLEELIKKIGRKDASNKGNGVKRDEISKRMAILSQCFNVEALSDSAAQAETIRSNRSYASRLAEFDISTPSVEAIRGDIRELKGKPRRRNSEKPKG